MERKPKFQWPLSPRRPRSPSSVSSSSSSSSAFSLRLPSFSSDAGDSFVSAEDCFEEDKRESSVSSKEAITEGYGGRSAMQFVIFKKEVLIKVQMNNDKCRTKAMKLIAAQCHVESVAIDGEDKDHFLVTGDNFDCVQLTRTLRKKVGNGRTRTLRKKDGYAEIVSVKEVKKEESQSYTENMIQIYVPSCH